MPLRVKAIYLSIVLTLLVVGYLLGFHYWWVDMDPPFLVFIACGIVWFGAIYLSLLIVRLSYFTDLGYHYIGLIELTDTKFLKDSIGIDKAKRLRLLHTLFAFSIFFLIVIVFCVHTKRYETYQLFRYGIETRGVVEKVSFSNGRRISFSFDYQQTSFQKTLHSKNYNVGDTILITFSSLHPDIVGLNEKVGTQR